MNWSHLSLSQLLVAATLSVLPLYAQSPPLPSMTPAERAHLRIPGMFDLDVGWRYEMLHRWKEAEQEYLQAGRTGAQCVKKAALEGLKRLEPFRPADDTENFEFDLARFYEKDKDWKNAELHYAAAGKDSFGEIRKKAMEGVKTASEHQWLAHFVEDLDRWLGYVARALGLLLIPLIARKIYKVWRAIECAPFVAPNDEASKLIGFSLADAREELPALLAPPMATLASHVVDFFPLMILPGLDDEFRDPIEDLEVGEIKLPLASWIKAIKRPKIRIEGRWNVGGTMGTAHARIRSRYWFFTFRESKLARFPVPSAAGDAQNLQLSLFAYDVLVKAVFSYHGL